MFEGLFDIKNDRRLSIYLYRFGLLVWCAYLVAGVSDWQQLVANRSLIGFSAGFLLFLAFGTHLVYESVHDRHAYQFKKKWFIIGMIFVSVLVYVMEFGAPSLPQLWVKILNLIG